MASLYYVSYCLLYICGQLSSSNAVTSKYLEFSNQKESYIDEATNYATLKSATLEKLPSAGFTICSSIYIAFFRSKQAFYAIRKNDQQSLWFSLFINTQDIKTGRYLSVLVYDGGSIFSNTGREVNLKPHAWSHACTTVDVESAHVMVAINGVLTHNTTIPSKDFTDNVPPVFQNSLVLGITQEKYIGTADINLQSEASVTNVNVFSFLMETSKVIEVTSSGNFDEGDVVSWYEATWEFVGSVQTVTNDDTTKPYFPNLFKMTNFRSWDDCMNLCPSL